MELKEYQKQVNQALSQYLVALAKFKTKYDLALQTDRELAEGYHFPEKAWTELGLTNYHQSKNILGEPLPSIFYRIPTGGGKTLLACHSIDLVNKLYLSRQNGLVLWIVPTTQIYNQTLKALSDRNHPYRQFLDISSGSKTLILEKLDHFTPQDIEDHLAIMLLMLPSAARVSKETLKVFQDNSGYTEFFPAEDDYNAQQELLKATPNLDTFGAVGELYGNLPLTSMGNVLKLLRPMVIIDEGHKAYSATARDTIKNFNPSFVLELSATPPEGVNELVQVTGKQLDDAQMIKLDIHLTNKGNSSWHDTVAEAKAHRDQLEKIAREYEQNTNKYIRPIMLIQVERTGKDQRDGVHIHSEDAREYLIKQCAVPPEHIAVKSSDKDEIENIDLLDDTCPIRFIITKQALQEGWDCPFAYILVALANSQSTTAMTQLVGRILRQPYAIETKVKELDECYVYTYQYNTGNLVEGIKNNLESEGLGDIAGRMSVKNGTDQIANVLERHESHFRPKFSRFAGHIYLPVFAIKEGDSWREVEYTSDLLRQVDWSQVSLDSLTTLSLDQKAAAGVLYKIGIREGGHIRGEEAGKLQIDSEIDHDYIARQLSDIIPNPWIGYELGEQAIKLLSERYKHSVIAKNIVYIIEELKKTLFAERDRLTEAVFRNMLKEGTIKLFLLKGDKRPSNPSLLASTSVEYSNEPFNAEGGYPLKRSLFDYIGKENINGLERDVALYLEKQEQLLWWYRNMSRSQYRIQGWRPGKIYPDFLASRAKGEYYDKIYVLETKGEHLGATEDTNYKRSIFNLCNNLAVESTTKELDLGFDDPTFTFHVVDEDRWSSQLVAILNNR
jgi:type III restriction enzyme